VCLITAQFPCDLRHITVVVATDCLEGHTTMLEACDSQLSPWAYTKPSPRAMDQRLAHLSTVYSPTTNLRPTAAQIAKPPEFFCLGSPAASNVPFANLRNACAVLSPGATYVTL